MWSCFVRLLLEQMSVSTEIAACIKYYKHFTRLCSKKEKRGSPDLPEICCLGVCARAGELCTYVSKRLLKENDSRSECIWQSHKDFPCPSRLQKTFLWLKSAVLLVSCVHAIYLTNASHFFFFLCRVQHMCCLSHVPPKKRKRRRETVGLIPFVD